MSRDSDFLSRWARRKAQVREEEKRELVAKDPEPETTEASDNQAAEITEEELAALPDPDSLEHGADFKPFLRPGVPQALRHRALRRIWRVNPSIGFLDGMNEYDLDYTDAATVVENLKTAYQVGRGFVLPDEEDEKQADEAVTGSAASEGEDSAAEAPELSSDGQAEDDETLRTEALSDSRQDSETVGLAEAPASAVTQDGVSSRPELEPNRPTAAHGEAAARRWARFSTPGQS